MNAKSMVVLSAAIAMIAHTGTVLADVPLNEHPVPLVSNDVPVGATQSLSPNLCIPSSRSTENGVGKRTRRRGAVATV